MPTDKDYSHLAPFDPAPNSAFLSSDPYFQFAWDSVSLGDLKDCQFKYFLSIVCGWNSNVPKPALVFGILYHQAGELWDKLLAEGVSKPDALYQVVHCTALRAKNELPEGDHRRTTQTLTRSIIWYLDQFHDDSAKTVILANGKPAVELSFSFEFDRLSDGTPIYLSGHIDRLVEFSGSLWFLDRKTTGSQLNERYFAQFTPDNQMSLYSLASKIILERPAAGGIIDAVQLAVNFARFKRAFIYRTAEQLDEWIEDTKFWIGLARQCATERHWPMNEKSCSKFASDSNPGGCPYRSVCAKSPSVREIFLRSDFTRRVWDPLEER